MSLQQLVDLGQIHVLSSFLMPSAPINAFEVVAASSVFAS